MTKDLAIGIGKNQDSLMSKKPREKCIKEREWSIMLNTSKFK